MTSSPTTPFSVCVYCGSRPGTRPDYTRLAEDVGRWIGTQGGQLVYGGGKTGLMGTVAEATRQAGGRVVGVIPRALVDKEVANHACDELHVVETMHERKALMGEKADAFLALPGGIGTLEEFFEVWTWRQLGYHDKPIGLLDHEGYFKELLAFLRQSIAQGFMGEWQIDLIRTHPEPLSLLEALRDESAGRSRGDRLAEVV